jgi:hypothetical protein
MQGYGLGAGLAAIAFWGFIASVVVAGIWYDIRKREAQHETVRRLMESGQKIDEGMMDKLLQLSGEKVKRLDRVFKLTGLIILACAIGLGIFGYVLGLQYPGYMNPVLGAAALLLCVGIGFLVASNTAKGWDTPASDSKVDRLMG